MEKVMMTSSANTLSVTAQRGAQWMLARLERDGSLQGASGLDDYYKAPIGLILTGHAQEADRLLDFVVNGYLQEDGDLDGRDLSWMESFRVYPHAWLTIAAMMLGRFEVAHSMLRVLSSYHDESTGGFFATRQGRDQRQGPQEIMSTGAAALACLWAGRLDIARRAGAWFEHIYDAQPDLSGGLYHVWDSDSGLVTEFPQDQAISYRVDASQTEQWYFMYGISAAFLSCLSGATREKKWLELAQKFLRASGHCQEDVYRQTKSGKIGWGAAWSYRLSRDPEDRRVAESVGAGLQTLQHEDGYWRAGVSVYDMQAGKTGEASLAATAEFVTLLSWMCLDLDG